MNIEQELQDMKKIGVSNLRPSMQTLKEKKELIGMEIGLGGGQNSANIIQNLNIKKLYILDYMNRNDEFIPFLRSQNNVVLLQGFSSHEESSINLIQEKLDFLYIDGEHSYAGCKRDLELWAPKVKKEGLISGHDYDLEGVKLSVDEFAEKNGYIVKFGSCKDNHCGYRHTQEYQNGEILDWYLIKN